ncbi:threonine/serine exporter family protein [Dorea sp.]
MIIKIIANLACSFIGTIAYAVMFQVPRRFYIGCGITGSVGWMMYKFASVYCSVAAASFIGTVCAVLVARMLTVRLKCPITIFMISGIITLVPGAGIYFTAYYLVTNQFAMAAVKGIGAIKVAFGIVLGIVCIVSVPREVFQKEYWVERKIAKQQKKWKDGSDKSSR